MTHMFSDLASYVDQRIDAKRETIQVMGTIVTCDGSIIATVEFDGGGTHPVLIFRNVRAKPGDRVGLQKYGSDWIVTGTLGEGVPNMEAFYHVVATSGNTFSTSFVDMPGPLDFTFEKRYDYTRVIVDFSKTSYLGSGNDRFSGFGVKMTGLDSGIVVFKESNFFFFNVSGVHHASHGLSIFPGGNGVNELPHDTYTARLQWRTTTGGAQATHVDTNDEIHLTFTESFT